MMMALPFLVNSSLSFIYFGRVPRTVNTAMVKRSSTATSLSVISAGPEDRARKVGVAYSNTSRFLMLTSSPLHQRMIPYVSHPVYMHGIYRYKRSRLVRAEGCSNLVCGMYLKCRPVLKYTQSSHIGNNFQVQNHSAVGLCMVAQGEGAKVSGETAQSIPTTCGNYLLLCSHVGKLLDRSDPPKL